MQELDRYPLVERTVSDVRILSDPGFSGSIRNNLERMLKGEKPEVVPISTFIQETAQHTEETSKTDEKEKAEHEPLSGTRAAGPNQTPSASSSPPSSPAQANAPLLADLDKKRESAKHREDTEQQQEQPRAEGEGNHHGEVNVSPSPSAHPVTHDNNQGNTTSGDANENSGDGIHGNGKEAINGGMPSPPLPGERASDGLGGNEGGEEEMVVATSSEPDHEGNDIDMQDDVQTEPSNRS
ncbi:hypothetical protein AX16_000051 [Volvariella volvacea WC 439]|nr:hypothetical protein AX16_000051 [Volvariella volvacea WC 439]